MRKVSILACILALGACTDPISNSVAQNVVLTQIPASSDGVPTYRATGLKPNMNNLQTAAVLSRYATLPGAQIVGPDGAFTVRKISHENGTQRIVAIDTGLTSGNTVVSLIDANTDCEIPRGARITPLNVGITRYGHAVFCG